MPTYEYRCRECGETLDVVQSFTDDPLTECPACEGQLKKVFSPVGISFKGGGFYKTDSRGAPSKAGVSSSSKDGDSGSGSSDSSAKDSSSSSESGGDGSSSDTKSSSSDTKSSTPKKDAKTPSSSSS
jgi:putative FmdB family regulatory protein